MGIAIALGPEVFGKSVPWFLNYAAGALGAIGFPLVYKRALPLLTSLLGAIAVAWALGRETDLWMLGILTVSGAMLQTVLASRR